MATIYEYKQKTIQKNIFLKKYFLWVYFSKSWNGREFMKLRPKTESRSSWDHEFWNHEMRGSLVYSIQKSQPNKRQPRFLEPRVLHIFLVRSLVKKNTFLICTVYLRIVDRSTIAKVNFFPKIYKHQISPSK